MALFRFRHAQNFQFHWFAANFQGIPFQLINFFTDFGATGFTLLLNCQAWFVVLYSQTSLQLHKRLHLPLKSDSLYPPMSVQFYGHKHIIESTCSTYSIFTVNFRAVQASLFRFVLHFLLPSAVLLTFFSSLVISRRVNTHNLQNQGLPDQLALFSYNHVFSYSHSPTRT